MSEKQPSNSPFRFNEGLKELYLQHRPAIVNWLRKAFSIDIDDAIDITQEAFAIFIEQGMRGVLPSFINQSKARTYLFGIAKNKAYERLRDQNKQVSLAEYKEPKDQAYEDIESNVEKEEQIKQANQAFKSLGEKCQKLLHLTIVLKVTMVDVAKKLNYGNAATAKNMKYKCLIRLRKIYHKHQKELQNG